MQRLTGLSSLNHLCGIDLIEVAASRGADLDSRSAARARVAAFFILGTFDPQSSLSDMALRCRRRLARHSISDQGA